MYAHTHYGAFTKNLGAFLDGLPESSVRFLYFGNDMSKPLIKDTFKEWTPPQTQPFYLLGGTSANYCYIYRKAEVVGVYKGDHVTFGIVAGRNDAVYIKTHITTYTEDVLNVAQYIKSRSECNFTFDRANLATIAQFSASTQCENVKFAAVSLGAFYAPQTFSDAPMVIYLLCCAVAGIVFGGRRPRRTKTAPVIQGRRGGRYTVVAGRKKYIKVTRAATKGGAIAGYKGITFMTDAFVDFLSRHMLQAVKQARPGLLSASVMLDELLNTNILLAYDFEGDTRNLFYIDSVMALTACYASTAPAPLAAETVCLERFMAMAVRMTEVAA